MFEVTGFTVEEVRVNRSKSWKFILLRIATLGLLRRMEVYQYIVRAKRQTI
jgi:hypothetical protein